MEFPEPVISVAVEPKTKADQEKMGTALQRLAEEDPTFKDMGTTLTAALIYPSEKLIYVFNVGDSRTYIYNGLLHQVTIDQNVLNE